MMGVVVLAHQGGWDEILLVLAPIALFAVLLLVANKRAGRLADEEDAEREQAEQAQQAEQPDDSGR